LIRSKFPDQLKNKSAKQRKRIQKLARKQEKAMDLSKKSIPTVFGHLEKLLMNDVVKSDDIPKKKEDSVGIPNLNNLTTLMIVDVATVIQLTATKLSDMAMAPGPYIIAHVALIKAIIFDQMNLRGIHVPETLIEFSDLVIETFKNIGGEIPEFMDELIKLVQPLIGKYGSLLIPVLPDIEADEAVNKSMICNTPKDKHDHAKAPANPKIIGDIHPTLPFELKVDEQGPLAAALCAPASPNWNIKEKATIKTEFMTTITAPLAISLNLSLPEFLDLRPIKTLCQTPAQQTTTANIAEIVETTNKATIFALKMEESNSPDQLENLARLKLATKTSNIKSLLADLLAIKTRDCISETRMFAHDNVKHSKRSQYGNYRPEEYLRSDTDNTVDCLTFYFGNEKVRDDTISFIKRRKTLENQVNFGPMVRLDLTHVNDHNESLLGKMLKCLPTRVGTAATKPKCEYKPATTANSEVVGKFSGTKAELKPFNCFENRFHMTEDGRTETFGSKHVTNNGVFHLGELPAMDDNSFYKVMNFNLYETPSNNVMRKFVCSDTDSKQIVKLPNFWLSSIDLTDGSEGLTLSDIKKVHHKGPFWTTRKEICSRFDNVDMTNSNRVDAKKNVSPGIELTSYDWNSKDKDQLALVRESILDSENLPRKEVKPAPTKLPPKVETDSKPDSKTEDPTPPEAGADDPKKEEVPDPKV